MAAGASAASRAHRRHVQVLPASNDALLYLGERDGYEIGVSFKEPDHAILFVGTLDQERQIYTSTAYGAHFRGSLPFGRLRAHFGHDLSAAIADAEEALAKPIPADPAAFEQFVFLGGGWTVGLTGEAALKLREAGGAWAESYPAMEYRHGPISVAGERTLVWMLGRCEPALLADIRETGASVVENGADPMAALVGIQRAAVALAQARGLDPDRPRHLTRSVVLP